MLSSKSLLMGGINDLALCQGAWMYEAFSIGNYATDDNIDAVSRNENNVDVVYRTTANDLIHVNVSAKPWYTGTLDDVDYDVINVSYTLRNEKNYWRIQGQPYVIKHTADSLNVIAQGEGKNMYHFHWQKASGWPAESVTGTLIRPEPFWGSDRYFINKITDVKKGSTIDVVAIGECIKFESKSIYCGFLF
jgi:hypothetical protein